MLKNAKTFLRENIEAFLNQRFEHDKLKMLFMYGHMRSGSSLLVHILNSNPQIIGYGETHRVYKDRKDFGKTAFDVYRSFKKLPFGNNYLMDKVLHSYLIEDPKLLKCAKTIFLIRHPKHTFASMWKLKSINYSPEETFKYYTERLDQIKTATKLLEPMDWTYITYDQLIEDEESCFIRLQRFLSLKSKLSAEYETIWSTGKRGIGDPSETIKKGRIVKNKGQANMPEALNAFVKEAEKAYTNCLEILSKNEHATPI